MPENKVKVKKNKKRNPEQKMVSYSPKERPEPLQPELTDAGEPRQRATGSLGWRKHTQNSDIRDAMAAKGIGQVRLAKIVGMNTGNINRMLQRELPDNLRQALFETIKRYDPETNPHGI